MSSPAVPAPTATTWLGHMFSTFKTDAETFLKSIVNVVEHEAWPFIQTLFHSIALDAIAKLKPLAEQALVETLAELETDLPTLFADGGTDFLKAFNSIVAKLFQAAETDVKDATTTDVLAAAHAVLLNAKATIAKPSAT